MTPTSEWRRAVSLTLPGELVDAARALGVNASQAAEAGIAAAVQRAHAESWLAANEAAIAAARGVARSARHAPRARLARVMVRVDIHRCRRRAYPTCSTPPSPSCHSEIVAAVDFLQQGF